MIRKYITNLNDKVYNKPIECINCYNNEIIKINKDDLQYYTQNLDEIKNKLDNEQERKTLNFHTSFPNMLHHDIYYVMGEQQIQEVIYVSINNVDAEDGNESIVLNFDKVIFNNNAFIFLVLTNIKCTIYIKNCRNMHLDAYSCNKIILENCKLHHDNINTNEYNDRIFYSDVEFIKCRLCYSTGIYINGACVAIEDECEDSEDVKGYIPFYLKGEDNRIIVDTDSEERLFINDNSYNSENIYEGLEIVNLNKARGFDNITKAEYFDELIRGLKYKYVEEQEYNKNNFSHFTHTIYDLDCFTEEEKEAIRLSFGDLTHFAFDTIKSTQELEITNNSDQLKNGMKFILDCIVTKKNNIDQISTIERHQMPCVIVKNSEICKYKLYDASNISYVHSFKCIFTISEYDRNKDIEPISGLTQIDQIIQNDKVIEIKLKPSSDDFQFEEGHIYCLSGLFNIDGGNINTIPIYAGLHNGSDVPSLQNVYINYTSGKPNYTVNSFFKYTDSNYKTSNNNLPSITSNDGTHLVFGITENTANSIGQITVDNAYLYDATDYIGYFADEKGAIVSDFPLNKIYNARKDEKLKFNDNYNIMRYFWAFKATEGKKIVDINIVDDEYQNIFVKYIGDDGEVYLKHSDETDISIENIWKIPKGENILIISTLTQSTYNYPFYKSDEEIYFKKDLNNANMYGKYPIITYKEVEDATNANL